MSLCKKSMGDGFVSYICHSGSDGKESSHDVVMDWKVLNFCI